MTPTIGRVVLVKWTPGENRPRLMGMETERSGSIVCRGPDGTWVVNVNIPNPANPVLQVLVPELEGVENAEGLSWRWPPRS